MLKRIYDYIRYDIPRGIKNLIIWLPAVWQDRQWDHQFIYMILRHKLHLQEQFIREHGIHENNIQDADQIKECVNLLDRLIEDDYHTIAFEEHDRRWGKAEMSWEDIEDDSELKNDHGMVQLEITHPKVRTEKDADMQRTAFMRACETEDRLRKRDMANLFHKIYKNIQGWWD